MEFRVFFVAALWIKSSLPRRMATVDPSARNEETQTFGRRKEWVAWVDRFHT